MKTCRPILLLLCIALLSAKAASAAPRGQIVAIDNSVFVAMVDPSIESCIRVQEKDNWCWAACIQMILRYNAVVKSQDGIVGRVYGSPYNWTASGNEIADAFDGWQGFTVKAMKSKTAQTFINEISAGRPLILGYGAHAYLLTHIYYTKASTGSLSPFKAIVINPATGREEVLAWRDLFSTLNTIVSFYR